MKLHDKPMTNSEELEYSSEASGFRRNKMQKLRSVDDLSSDVNLSLGGGLNDG